MASDTEEDVKPRAGGGEKVGVVEDGAGPGCGAASDGASVVGAGDGLSASVVD